MIRISRLGGCVVAASILAVFFAADHLRAQALPEWLTRVNLYRATAGLPDLTENVTYSDAAWKHARYIVKTHTLGHSEDPANPWYTPEGATAAAGSVLTESGSSTLSEDSAIDMWMRAPFHAVGILDPKLRSTGFAIYREADGGYQTGAGLDVLRGRSKVPAGVTFPVVWPGNGSSVPITTYLTEHPSPLTSCPGYVAPAGLPIIVQLGTGSVTPNVTASSFSSNGVALGHCVFSETTYVNADPAQQSVGRAVLAPHDAIVLIPRAPLTAGASYNVSITTNGMALRWSFSASPSVGCSHGVTPVSATAPGAGGAGLTVTTATGCY